MPAKSIKKNPSFQTVVGKLVQMNLAFHNLNKTAEDTLGLSLVQYHLLHTLRDLPGSSPQRFAHAVGMHPSTLTQSMKRLQKKNVIFVEEDPRDSRKKIMGLTRDGEISLKNFEKRRESLPTLKKDQESTLSLFGLVKSLRDPAES